MYYHVYMVNQPQFPNYEVEKLYTCSFNSRHDGEEWLIDQMQALRKIGESCYLVLAREEHDMFSEMLGSIYFQGKTYYLVQSSLPRGTYVKMLNVGDQNFYDKYFAGFEPNFVESSYYYLTDYEDQKKVRLSYPKAVSELKDAQWERKYVCWSKAQIKYLKRQANRATRRQAKNYIDEYLTQG